jgi:methyl-accepting chemotaxis protein
MTMEHMSAGSRLPGGSDGETARMGEACSKARNRLVDDLAPRLTQVADTIEPLIHRREDDFLRLGEIVMEFSEQSRLLSEKALTLSGMVSAGSLEDSVAILSGQVSECLDVCNAGATSECLTDIESLRAIVHGVHERFIDFRKIVRNLQMLGIATRIESARIGDLGTGFVNLSQEVDSLAQSIVRSVGTIQERTKRLELVVNQVRDKAREIHAEQVRCSEGIRIDMERSLQALARINGNADLVTAKLSERTQEISGSLSTIVSSLQFHDIVRQQVEHITHSLQEVAAELEHGADGAEPGPEEINEAMLLNWAKDVGRLSGAQIRNASSRLMDAVEDVREGLRQIGETARETAGEADVLIRGGSSMDGDLLEDLRRSTEAVVAMTEEFGASMRGIARQMDELGATVSDMEGFLETIESVGEEIELIALNATINAARTGETGRPLSVLAEAIRQLSVRARRDTSRFTDTLREIMACSELLKGRAAGLVSHTGLERLTQGQKSLLARIAEVSGSFNSMLGDVQHDGEALGLSLRTHADAIGMHLEICAMLDWAADELERAISAIPEICSQTARRPERLNQLLSRYTMEMERIVYHSTFGSKHDDRDQCEVHGHAQETTDGGWDNVELF